MAVQRVGDADVEHSGGLRAIFRLNAEPSAAWQKAFREAGAFSVFAIQQAVFNGDRLSVSLPREQDLTELTTTVDRCIHRANQ